MSDLISAWVDEDEMRRLAESLLARPSHQDYNKMEVNYGSKFEGFTAQVDIAQAPVEEMPPERQIPPATVVNKVIPSPAPSTATTPQPVPVESEPTSIEPTTPADPVTHAASPPDTPAEPRPPFKMRSAVQFLKKAQAEGKAGGILRSSKPTTAFSSQEAFSSPPEPPKEKREIHSPFRRASEVEQKEEAPVSPPVATANLAPQHPVSSYHSQLQSAPTPSANEPILARVTQFGKWLKGPVRAQQFFITNTEGKILVDEVQNPKFIQMARSLGGNSRGNQGEVGSLHVRIGDNSVLEVVPTPSQFGTLILGLIVEAPLPENWINQIRTGLEKVANARLISRTRR